jgi:hypothetical protein
MHGNGGSRPSGAWMLATSVLWEETKGSIHRHWLAVYDAQFGKKPRRNYRKWGMWTQADTDTDIGPGFTIHPLISIFLRRKQPLSFFSGGECAQMGSSTKIKLYMLIWSNRQGSWDNKSVIHLSSLEKKYFGDKPLEVKMIQGILVLDKCPYSGRCRPI